MNILDTLKELTGGKPYVLMIMPFQNKEAEIKEYSALFDTIKRVVENEFKICCIRADELHGAGYDLLAKIHQLIHRAELIIAECSDVTRANVFYELGYAMGIQKHPLLLIQKDHQLPYNLRGLEVIEYTNSFAGLSSLKTDLAKSLHLRLKSDLPTLRDMLGPLQPMPSYIVASPKYPGKHSRIQGQVYDTRTYGDHLGILGIISAFGSMYGETKGIELISAKHASPNILNEDCNLYLIGSYKVNPPVEKVLNHFQNNCWPQWVFDPAPGWRKGKTGDWPVALYKNENFRKEHKRGNTEIIGENNEEIWTSDYGLIVRGSHPYFSNRLVLIMAGPHSLGTGAACLAATRSEKIREIREKLPVGTLEDKRRVFWALVKGTANRKDFLLDQEGVTIESAGVYQ